MPYVSQDSHLKLIKSKAKEPMIYGTHVALLPWKETNNVPVLLKFVL